MGAKNNRFKKSTNFARKDKKYFPHIKKPNSIVDSEGSTLLENEKITHIREKRNLTKI